MRSEVATFSHLEQVPFLCFIAHCSLDPGLKQLDIVKAQK